MEKRRNCFRELVNVRGEGPERHELELEIVVNELGVEVDRWLDDAQKFRKCLRKISGEIAQGNLVSFR